MCFSVNNFISDSEDLYFLGDRERPSFLKFKVPSYRIFIYSHKHHSRVVIPIYLISKIKYKKTQLKEQHNLL